jgi:hypothetical protein
VSRVSPELRRVITQRAGGRCEYCGLAQDGQEATFHVDHIKPLAAGGQTTAENLALACVSCFSSEGRSSGRSRSYEREACSALSSKARRLGIALLLEGSFPRWNDSDWACHRQRIGHESLFDLSDSSRATSARAPSLQLTLAGQLAPHATMAAPPEPLQRTEAHPVPLREPQSRRPLFGKCAMSSRPSG